MAIALETLASGHGIGHGSLMGWAQHVTPIWGGAYQVLTFENCRLRDRL
jgi:hypothetical protein